MNETAIYIAQLLAPVYILAAAMLILRPNTYDDIMKDFEKSPGLTYMSGMIALVVGIIWVKALFNFDTATEGIMSVIGAMAITKGALLIVCPKILFKINYKSAVFRTIGSIGVLILSIWLLHVGYGLF